MPFIFQSRKFSLHIQYLSFCEESVYHLHNISLELIYLGRYSFNTDYKIFQRVKHFSKMAWRSHGHTNADLINQLTSLMDYILTYQCIFLLNFDFSQPDYQNRSCCAGHVGSGQKVLLAPKPLQWLTAADWLRSYYQCASHGQQSALFTYLDLI